MAEITADDIAAAALGPQEVTIDGTTVKAATIDELLKARDAVAGITAAAANPGGAWGAVIHTRLIPPGAIGPIQPNG